MWRRARIALSGRQRQGAETRPVEAVHGFDRQFGVETSGMIWGDALKAAAGDGEDAAYWATGYYGVAPSVLWGGLDALGLAWKRFTFVDVGCGKGRAMMLATRYPFREVRGVELSPELAGLAEENLARFAAEWREREVPVTVVVGDATTFALPAGPLVLWLFHPFAAPVMRRFLANVERALEREPREIWMMYSNPELHPMIAAQPWLEVVWDRCLGMSEEDRAADRFGSEWERTVAYRSRG